MAARGELALRRKGHKMGHKNKSEHDKGMEVLAKRFQEQDEALRRLGQRVLDILSERDWNHSAGPEPHRRILEREEAILEAARSLGLLPDGGK
jgi:hypothetical protein